VGFVWWCGGGGGWGGGVGGGKGLIVCMDLCDVRVIAHNV